MTKPKVEFIKDIDGIIHKMLVHFESIDETWIYEPTKAGYKLIGCFIGFVRYNYDRQYRAFFRA